MTYNIESAKDFLRFCRYIPDTQPNRNLILENVENNFLSNEANMGVYKYWEENLPMQFCIYLIWFFGQMDEKSQYREPILQYQKKIQDCLVLLQEIRPVVLVQGQVSIEEEIDHPFMQTIFILKSLLVGIDEDLPKPSPGKARVGKSEIPNFYFSLSFAEIQYEKRGSDLLKKHMKIILGSINASDKSTDNVIKKLRRAREKGAKEALLSAMMILDGSK